MSERLRTIGRTCRALAGADGAVEVKSKRQPSKARRPRRDRIARPASVFRRRPSANEIAC